MTRKVDQKVTLSTRSIELYNKLLTYLWENRILYDSYNREKVGEHSLHTIIGLPQETILSFLDGCDEELRDWAANYEVRNAETGRVIRREIYKKILVDNEPKGSDEVSEFFGRWWKRRFLLE